MRRKWSGWKKLAKRTQHQHREAQQPRVAIPTQTTYQSEIQTMDTIFFTPELSDDLIRFFTVAAEQSGDRWRFVTEVIYGDSDEAECSNVSTFRFLSADEAIEAGCESCYRELANSQLLDVLEDWKESGLITRDELMTASTHM